MKELLGAPDAAARAVRLARAGVVASFPAFPRDPVLGLLEEEADAGRWEGRLVRAATPRGALAAALGAAAAGERAFTAAGAGALAAMHDLLHWGASLRIPAVLADAHRSPIPGGALVPDSTDALAQRDTGWIQIDVETPQEALDTTILAFRLAASVGLPVLVGLDAEPRGQGAEPVEVPDAELVDRFLGAPPASMIALRSRAILGGPVAAARFPGRRMAQQEAMTEAVVALEFLEEEWGAATGRRRGAIESFGTTDAELVVVASGSLAGLARTAVARRRAMGEAIGMVRLRTFRPFPSLALRSALAPFPRVAVLDRDLSPGRGGILASELRATLYNLPPDGPRPVVFGFVLGLGRRPVDLATVDEVIEQTLTAPPGMLPLREDVWVGVDE